jgi:hypothetical protein
LSHPKRLQSDRKLVSRKDLGATPNRVNESLLLESTSTLLIVPVKPTICIQVCGDCDMKPPALMDDDDQVLEPTHAENALSTHAEASKMLEAALQQMDGIIAGR